MTPLDPIRTAGPNKDFIRFQAGFKYQLTEDSVYPTKILPPADIDTKFVSLSRDGMMILRAGFAWNGVSGPTVQRNSNRRGGAFHDGVYRLIRFGLMDFLPRDEVREKADNMLKEIWLADGMWSWLVKAEIAVLKRFGEDAARPSGEPEVMTSP